MTAYQVEPSRSLLCATVYSSLHSIERRGPVTGEIQIRDTPDARVHTMEGQLLLDLTTMSSSDSLYDRELESRLDIDRYPRVTARLTAATPEEAADGYRMSGELTFHGRTRQVDGTATVTSTDDELRLTGQMALDVREFGIEPPKILLLKVKPVVDVVLDLVALRQT